jgi:tRNA threonylcarbamoyladenosine biosynthesis protein TsaB
MLVLALDTTSRAGSVALARNGDLLGCHIGEAGRTHAERLPTDLIAHLDRHALSLTDVDLFAVAAGPGSFTGLRIGIATIQGLAFACGRPVVAVSALDALARLGSAPGEDRVVAAWIDAQRREVFSALYRCGPAADRPEGELVVMDPAAVGAPEGTLERWSRLIAGRSIWFVGDGALAYRRLIDGAGFPQVRVADPTPPLAPAIARIATRAAALHEATSPHAIKPLYVRRPDAELARDRRAPEP